MTAEKTAAVTGSSRGIGYAAAEALAREGYHVILSATGTAEQHHALVEYFGAQGLKTTYIQCDISSPADRAHFFAEISARFGRLDVLVNNAGVAPKKRLDILETTQESFERVLEINLEGTFFMCQQAARLMIHSLKAERENYRPRIINISSMSAYTSSVNRGEYCISKAGISMTTQLFADRLAEYGIPVFEIRPGIIRTDMTAGAAEKYQKLIDSGLTPIRRFGNPEDVADCVMAAVSGRLDFATGQILNADGGFHIRRL